MLIVFDENIPRCIVDIINLIDNDREIEISSIQDLNLRGMIDIEICRKIRKIAGDRKAILVSADKCMTRNSPEVEALSSNGITIFVCPPSFCSKNTYDRCIYLMNAWKGIKELSIRLEKRKTFYLPARNPGLTVNEIQKNSKKE